VRDALSVGNPAPPPTSNPVDDSVRFSLAHDDVRGYKEELSHVVTDVLAELRRGRDEFDLDVLSDGPLRRSILTGPGQTPLILETARRDAEKIAENHGVDTITQTTPPGPSHAA
jgi:hypothetical protein